jgi:4-hydroxy-3-polyprenylbenzoate decarboxylase
MRVLTDELSLRAQEPRQLPAALTGTPAAKFAALLNNDIGASIASGSYPVDGMVVLPCSVGTLGRIANGVADDLVGRAADVCLKECRRLVLCVRETPLSRIHLENMLRAQAAGAVVMPVIPAFYAGAKTIDDLVLQYVCRVLALLDLPQKAQFRWQGQAESAAARRLEIAARPRRNRR